ncbi:MAG: transposase [Proteobacteria bacterium]|nr:transposase [Pseudomonadota bacterium]
MKQLDELHLRYPFYGARRLRDAMLDEHGFIVNRKRVQRLMKLMGIRAVYPGSKKPSKPNKAHRIYACLHAYESLIEARTGLDKYFRFYNVKRKHQTLNAKPDKSYYTHLPLLKQAG